MKYFVKTEYVETQGFSWGTLQWLNEPQVTGSKVMVTGVVNLFPGEGHQRHNHEGCEEVLYVLKGTGVQSLELDTGKVEKEIEAGELIRIPAGVYHSTINNGKDPLEILAIYHYSGPEIAMKNDPDCQITAPQKN
ncbi:cupin domain-containing protein [Carnobacterium maltaromaticum]|jgi:oxalate decarboxylase/phosphoglucose isomerase-like protein (cupin superfamily)|uniref:cupin domain-containing protein n=1 Tax=Carnobacterium maltaromaticum TaxID=2751 RepID=UPI000E73C3B6|nr:cupin domain-containing protein [Carnobacterium maltaromaticum]AOA01032.1 cupin [Carnobacterium maltaromaticum]MCI1819710.1 cupin domain-containing protein [Carnobacterium maltaromaticum]